MTTKEKQGFGLYFLLAFGMAWLLQVYASLLLLRDGNAFGHDLMAGFRTLVGGEVTDYADMLTEARQIATGRMVKDAEALGADAIVGMRYASASVMQGAAEVIAYGTAVKFV